MAWLFLIGSRAVSEARSDSDWDFVRIGDDALPMRDHVPAGVPERLINVVDFDEATFAQLYENGSLFLHHVFRDGIRLSGPADSWERLRKGFEVQRVFQIELEQIRGRLAVMDRVEIFGRTFLMPLVHAHTELKNLAIFTLAHHGIYEFNKHRCLPRLAQHLGIPLMVQDLSAFYNYSVRELDVDLPFSPADEPTCSAVLHNAYRMAQEACNACR